MPTIESINLGQMSDLTWRSAASRVAGAIGMSERADAIAAAKDAISETLQDWDSRRDWRYTQVVAPDITIDSTTNSVDLPSAFKKPYVAYLNSNRSPLFYVERANWHRLFAGDTSRSIPRLYTLYNDASTGKADIFPPSGVSDTLTILYYRSILYTGADDDVLDIFQRWEGYILAGARSLLVGGKMAGDKALWWERKYEAGVKKAKEDDLRLPDQFLSFQPPGEFYRQQSLNQTSAWEDSWGVW